MNIVVSLRTLRVPLFDEDGDPCFALDYDDRAMMMRPIRFKNVFVTRVAELGTALSLSHALRRTYREVSTALRLSTVEMEWFKNYRKDTMPTSGRQLTLGGS